MTLLTKIFVVAILIATLAVALNYRSAQKHLAKIRVGQVEIFVEKATTNEEKAKGLSGRSELNQDEGMLFVWETDIYPSFWMKDMNFPIDIIWINDGEVIGIEENVRPEPGKKDSQLTLYHPLKPIDTVLEVNAGFTKENNIKEGDTIVESP